MNHQNNIDRIKTVHDALEEMKHEVVFVGGSTVSFYADQQAFEVRETDDVDVIIEVLNYGAHARFEEQLRDKGFTNVVTSKFKGRYMIQGITVDVMLTTDISMGFENKWYPEGFNQAMNFKLDQNTTIKILTPPHFIATKLEAFKNRGYKDPRQSQDFEDIVYILENRKKIWHEMEEASQNLKVYLMEEFTKLMADPYIYEWIDGHVEIGSPPSTDWIIEEVQKFLSGQEKSSPGKN